MRFPDERLATDGKAGITEEGHLSPGMAGYGIEP